MTGSFSSQFVPLSFPNLGLVRFPDVKVSPEDCSLLGLKSDASNREVLRHLAWRGYLVRKAKGQFKEITEQRVIDRFKTEFATFDSTGVHQYLLMVWDINRWCDKQGIIRGKGRGSAGGSLTLFALGVTDINPIKHDLNFPRFISEARMKPVIKDGVIYVDGKSAPDIDGDYQYARRNEVINYIEQRYPGRVCKISTRLELTGKMALKDTLKTYADYSEEEAKRVSDFIEARFGKVQSLYEALNGDGKDGKPNDDIKRWVIAAPRNKEIYEIAMAVENLAVARGMHPSGVFVSYDPLDGNVPTELSKTGEVVTSYDMETAAGVATKIDILGLRSLDLVADTIRLAGISIDDIDVNDPCIYQYMATKEGFVGMFQIEEGTTKSAVQQIKPRNVDELASVIAISRPGALRWIGTFSKYIATGEITPFYPPIDAILRSTGGALIMQEQITDICREVFGLSDIAADQVRYACGKKKKEEMAKWESVLIENGRARGIPESVTQSFWKTCDAASDYSFCKSHATLYAYLTATTTYLKVRHPQAFYLTMLRLAREEPNALEYMNTIMAEMRGHTTIRVLPPDITRSGADFQLEIDDADPTKHHIRFGLSSIKGVSDQTMVKLAAFRRQFTSKLDVFDAAKEAGVDIRVFTSLVYSGCLNWPNTPRTKLALEAQTYNLLSPIQKGKLRQFIAKHDDDVLATLKALPTITTEKGKPILPSSQLDTLRRDYEPYYAQYVANARNENLSSYIWERHLLGYSPTTTLFSLYFAKLPAIVELSTVLARGKQIAAMDPEDRPKGRAENGFSFVAWVVEAKMSFSRKGNTPYLKVKLEDDSGSIYGLLYGPENVESCRRANDGQLPEAGNIVSCDGALSKDGGVIFLSTAIIQPSPIKLKRSAIPDEIPV